ncbi:intradiol ring-cleavage dioxygenase [Sporothrix brasiliensis 5110]|uniref:Intradiol ring-cleavage dioxygenase n=1 Tax=Sporothrix brasiliensis 5110 TaxID=1398154 RepID=A0A0C2F8J2_9PEZI|nr:intradiol ring-cleavage dioxygenase [Sporothrix brasiliensis 5110]KIH87378.1 intradiol ring-cleavage dioxygenase [Sporothrix brasiliensis 5110]
MTLSSVRPRLRRAIFKRLLPDLSILFLSVFLLGAPALGAGNVNREIAYVYGTDSHGVTRQLAADRTPALYTSDFGDCLGGKSLFNISAFDAAYYADNMTVVFHLDGTSNVHNESTMLVITMDAYGETRYTQTFDPCQSGMGGLPLTIYGAFALVPMQTASIPDIALQIPDFDGSVNLQIFANSTQTEIGCFQAAMTNGNSIGIPQILAPTIAFFVAIAMICSFVTAAYGISVPLMRAHYAHSLSVVLFFETMQTFFLTGALSLHWPSVLVAWWSNFAWSAGIIRIRPLVAQIVRFTASAGNASQFTGDSPMFVKGGSAQLADKIYNSDSSNNGPVLGEVVSLVKRKVYNSSDPYDYTWGGDPVLPGVPLPGTWQSLSGTLSNLNIPGASAFTLCLFWTAIAAVAFPLGLIGMKGLFDLLSRLGWLREDCMAYFRTHSLQYARQGVFRVLLIALSPLLTLAVFQFTQHSSPGSTALAAIVLAILVAGAAYMCTDAIRRRNKHRPPQGSFSATQSLSPKSPSFTKRRANRGKRRISYLEDDGDFEARQRPGVHQDEKYIKRYGWLSARYKASCYWFFAVHLGTQFARACVLGGGADNVSVADATNNTLTGIAAPTAQLVVLLLFEIAVLATYAYWRPIESSRNLALGVWVLGMGRILVAALCIGLLPQVGISRIGATVIGFAIVVVQVLMLSMVLVLVAISAVSTWLSLTRNQDNFYSEMFFSVRKRYLETLLASATGAPAPLTRRQERKQAKARQRAGREAERLAASLPPPAPSFSVYDVRRAPKIEDVHYAESDESEVEEFGVHDVVFRRTMAMGLSGPSGSGSGRSSRGGSSDTTGPATENDKATDEDTLGALGELGTQSMAARKRRETGSAASLVGAQIYDPARILARLNRSRTSSAASLRSVPSAHDSIRRVSDMAVVSGPLPGPPQIGVLAGRRSASPFGGGRASPYDMRSSSATPVSRGDVSMTPTSLAGPISRRMTPTKETLQRYSTERQSLQSLRSTPVPYPVPE